MRKIACENCKAIISLKDIEVRKDDNDSSLFGPAEKCWCPKCGANIEADLEVVEAANPVFWFVTLLCLVLGVVVAMLQKPYSTILALILALIMGLFLVLTQNGVRKLFGIVLGFISIYLCFVLLVKI